MFRDYEIKVRKKMCYTVFARFSRKFPKDILKCIETTGKNHSFSLFGSILRVFEI